MTTAPTWPAGYAVRPRANTLSPELVSAFRKVPAAHASDCLGRGVGAIGLHAYHADLRLALCGPAITVRTRPGDNLMIHVAMQMAQPGDVIVIDGAGDLTQALIGGLMRTTALARGIAGFVVDGAVRDVAEWAEGGIAVYARGHTHRGPSKDGPGEVNVPIACAGMSVSAGDLVLADADGVLAVPAGQAAALLPLALAHAEREEKIRAGNRKGTPDPERFNALLRAKGCPV
jgi:RraA family protein